MCQIVHEIEKDKLEGLRKSYICKGCGSKEYESFDDCESVYLSICGNEECRYHDAIYKFEEEI